jgi:hypothetical protein
MCGGFLQASATMRSCSTQIQVLAFLAELARLPLDRTLRCELYDPDPDIRIPNWNKTWLVTFNGLPLAYADKQLTFRSAE